MQGISLIMSSFSSEIEDYSIQEAEGGGQTQGISLIMSSFSSEIEDYSIQEATSSFLSFLSPFNLLLFLFYYFNFLFNSGSVFTKQELLINTSSSSL